jgi:hypothetical protein
MHGRWKTLEYQNYIYEFHYKVNQLAQSLKVLRNSKGSTEHSLNTTVMKELPILYACKCLLMKRIYYQIICTEYGNQHQNHGDIIYSYAFFKISLNMSSLHSHQQPHQLI